MRAVGDEMSQKEKSQRVPTFPEAKQKRVPQALKELRRWINWRLIDRDGKPTKTPWSCLSRESINVKVEIYYQTFDDAASYCTTGKNPDFDRGIGFVLGGGIVGLDLDNCRSLDGTHVEAWALKILYAFNTYTEVSPSGTGFKLFFKGKLPRDERGKTRNRYSFKDLPGEFEVYDSDRFFTVTGDRISGLSHEVEDRQDVLDDFHRHYFGDPSSWSASRNAAEAAGGCPIPIDQLFERIKRSRSGEKFTRLMTGDASDYGNDYSRADYALASLLAFWVGPHTDKIQEIMLDSGLGEGREDKYDRDDYLPNTIERAIDNTNTFYDWAKPPAYEPFSFPVRRVGRHSMLANSGKDREQNNSAKITDTTQIQIVEEGKDSEESDTVATESETTLPEESKDWTQPNPLPKKPYQYPRSTAGFAEMLIDRWGDRILFCSVRKWLVWDGRKWIEDTANVVELLALDTIRYGLDPSVSDDLDDTPRGNNGTRPSIREEWKSYLLKLEDQTRIEKIVKSARKLVPTCPTEFDAELTKLNCANGVLDLETLELEPHNPTQRFCSLCPTPYDAKAVCPRFVSFLDQIFPDDRETINYIQELFGYFVTGIMSERILPIFFGTGTNGKSVLTACFQTALGRDYCTVAPNSMMTDGQGNVDYDIAELKGKRLAILDETDKGAYLKCGLVKRLTSQSGDLRGAKKYQASMTFQNTCKILILTNSKPRVPEHTNAIWSRLAPLEFTQTFYDPDKGQVGKYGYEVDKNLEERLALESVGILGWIARGAQRVIRQKGIKQSQTIVETRKEYRKEQDVFAAFLEDIEAVGIPDMPVEEAIDKGFYVTVKRLFAEYDDWSSATHKRVGFTELVTAHGYTILDQKKIHGKNLRSVVIGIRLAADFTQDLSDQDHVSKTIGINLN